MFRVILVFIVLITNTLCYSQEIKKMRAFSLMYSIGPKSDDIWSELEECDILVVFKETRIVIYSQKTQELDIISQTNTFDQEHGVCIDFKCVDSKGVECKVWFYRDKDPQFMSVNYPTWSYIYGLKEVE